MGTIAQFIHQNQQTIIEGWLRDARETASAQGLAHAALENLMPRLLSTFAEHLETRSEEAATRRRALLHSHLSTRLRQGYDLAEIVSELVALGRSITQAWTDGPGDRPAIADLELVHDELHVSIADATVIFRHHMLEDEQSEKRALRRIQAIASEALHDPVRPLRDRLRDVLEVIMGAMGAQCAAFLGFSVSKQELVLVACAGTEALEPYASSISTPSFCTEVATSEDPTTLYDTQVTALEIPDHLRHDGIHSLLGVRLPLHGDLLGVMYVGTDAKRDFTPRELRRIQTLAERMSVHLEHSRLFAELADKVDALRAEKAMRERFVSVLVHDLRAPLATARLAADALAQDTNGHDRRGLAPKIAHSLDRADRMIRDLLDANCIRAGEPLRLYCERGEMVAIVDEVAAEARAMYGDRFIVDARSRIPGAWSHDELYRALWNLVANAVKYGHRQRPIMMSVVHDKSRVRVSVHNEGAPIPADELGHIFDPYVRSRSTAERGGWGLGLTLVRGCAEAHGGSVEVVSTADAGTVFTIVLPLDCRGVPPQSAELEP